MDQGEAGRYRRIAVRVGRYVPPAPDDVSGLMFELLEWWNRQSGEISPVLSSAIVHFRFEAIIRLPMATGAPYAPLRFGNSTTAVSTPITFSPWTNTVGRIVCATTPHSKQCVEKVRISAAEAAREEQLVLIEQTPLEEAWENALDLLRKHLGEPTVNSWLKPLHVIGFENSTLTFRAPTVFIGDWVKAHYMPRLITAWKAVGYEVKSLQVEIRNKKSAA